jgi:plastocyanin
MEREGSEMKARICRGGVLCLALSILTAGQAYGANHVVSVVDNQFIPRDITITVGDTVQWDWNAGTMSHTVTSGTGSADPNSGDLFESGLRTNGGAMFEWTSTTDGLQRYFCIPHEITDDMKGTITVNPAPGGGHTSFDISVDGGRAGSRRSGHR